MRVLGNMYIMLLWNLRDWFWCAAILQNGISSLRVLFTLSSLHYWKEMAFGSKESHQPLAAKKSNEIWIVETLVGGQEKCQTIIKREGKGRPWVVPENTQTNKCILAQCIELGASVLGVPLRKWSFLVLYLK